jgi:transcriptional regulator with XRE-family HTH domain
MSRRPVNPFDREVGRALRRIRTDRGLTLRDVAERSSGRFRPTSVAGYERGERAISLARFCDLCELLGVGPDRLLIDILRALDRRPEREIDLTMLARLGDEEAELVMGFVRQVMAQRGEEDPDRIVLRAGDVEVLASASGLQLEELLRRLGRRPVSSEPLSSTEPERPT